MGIIKIKDCSEIYDLLPDYLDTDEKREELCKAIEEHLSVCHDCQIYVDTVKKTIMLYHESDRVVNMPMRVSEQLQEALSKAYQERQADRPAAD